MKRKAVLIFCFLLSILGNAQDNNLAFTLSLGNGWVAPINDFVRGINEDNTKITYMQNFSLRVTNEVDGTQPWHYLYNGYYYGFGLFHGRFNYSKNIGNPFGIYSIIGAHVVNTQRFALKTEVAFGLSGIWKGYSETNKYNVAVSTPVECYLHLDVEGQYNINDNFHANLGAAFIHFSNGTMKKPNKGLNILTPIIGLSYSPEKIVHTKKYKSSETEYDILSFTPHWQTLLSAYFGQKGVFVTYPNPDTNNMTDARAAYPIFGIQGRFQRQLTFTHSLGLCLDVTYNESIGKNVKSYYTNGFKDDLSLYQRFTSSIYLTYEYNLHNFSFVLDPGIYIYRHKENEKMYYSKFIQRIGLRYQFPKNIFAQFTLRAYDFRKADYIEWGIGYRFKHKFHEGKAIEKRIPLVLTKE